MKILIAPDSFKESMTAQQATAAIATGIRRVVPAAKLVQLPMADGGEGTVTALVEATGGEYRSAVVHDPLGRKVTAQYGLINAGQTAVIEVAAASGIQFIDPASQNPQKTSTYGTGELILAALDQGVQEIIIGLGGSGTTDGGAGLAQALGVHLLDCHGEELQPGGGELQRLAKIDDSELDPRLQQVALLLASDVTNPLTGPQGAAAVFGPQKGAQPADVTALDQGLHHYAQVIKQDLGKDVEELAGAGAAGGLGAGLLAFTPAHLQSGIDLVIKFSRLKEQLEGIDYAFTGEGKIDFQTQFGKTPAGVAKAVHQVTTAPVVGIAGKLGRGAEELCTTGLFAAIFAITNGAKSFDQAIVDSPADLATTAENVMRLLTIGH